MDDPNPDALFDQGMRRLPPWNYKGDDKAARLAEGLAIIERAAAAGSHKAWDYLASWAKTAKERQRWALALCEAGDVGEMATLLTNGDNPAKYGKDTLRAARAGTPWAQLVLSRIYGSGAEDTRTNVLVATVDGAYGWLPGVPDPTAESLAWAERAANAGFAPAHLDLAHDFKLDDPARALRHVRAALAGAPLPPRLRTQAERLLARLVEEVGDDVAAALPEREALAARGHAESIAWLGDRYRLGEGVPVDLARARALYEQAAAQADVDALRELGRMCEAGEGGPEDADRARALYEQAAELGADAFARDRLVERWGLTWYRREEGE